MFGLSDEGSRTTHPSSEEFVPQEEMQRQVLIATIFTDHRRCNVSFVRTAHTVERALRKISESFSRTDKLDDYHFKQLLTYLQRLLHFRAFVAAVRTRHIPGDSDQVHTNLASYYVCPSGYDMTCRAASVLDDAETSKDNQRYLGRIWGHGRTVLLLRISAGSGESTGTMTPEDLREKNNMVPCCTRCNFTKGPGCRRPPSSHLSQRNLTIPSRKTDVYSRIL
jgi:DNA-binding TFAR19-related protein (PDSD5 family)